MKTLFNSDKNTDTNINDTSNINLEDFKIFNVDGIKKISSKLEIAI